MKEGTIIFFLIIIMGCGINHDVNVGNNLFNNYIESIDEMHLPFSVDIKNDQKFYPNFDKVDYTYLVRDSLFHGVCGNVKQYSCKRVGKLKTKNSVLIFSCVELSKDCSIEAHLKYYLLDIYGLDGVFKEEKIIGELNEVFGVNMYKSFTVNLSDGESVRIEMNILEEVMDDDPDIFNSVKSQATVIYD